eukprot:4720295-Pyramimonas_sp.AAC.1
MVPRPPRPALRGWGGTGGERPAEDGPHQRDGPERREAGGAAHARRLEGGGLPGPAGGTPACGAPSVGVCCSAEAGPAARRQFPAWQEREVDRDARGYDSFLATPYWR